MALAEMALMGWIGARITPPELGTLPLFAWLFGEDQARYAVTAKDGANVLRAAEKAGVTATVIGTTGGAALTVVGADAISLAALADAQDSWFPRYMGD